LVETMAQVGGAGLRIIDPDRPEIYFFATLDKVKFRRQVRPGEEVRAEVTTLRNGRKVVRQAGKAFVGTEIAAEAEWMILSEE
jgi:3-hydroxyacyl-[acyl-carrier-protein] dehydratase